MTSLKRIQKELKMLQKKPISNVDSITTKGDNILNLVAVVSGPKDSAYEGGKWKVDIKLEGYPFRPPTVVFDTPIYHPHVDKASGAPCVDIIGTKPGDWGPTKKLADVFARIVSMMSSPTAESPVNAEMAKMIEANPAKFAATAAAHTAKYAK
eukprot:g556.t1